MEASASMTSKALGLKIGMRAFCCLNTNYVAGKMMLVRAMEIGMSIEVVEPGSIPFVVGTNAFDFIALVPLQVDAIMKSEFLPLLNKAQCIIIGGAPISYSLTLEIQNRLLSDVFHTYGMTETVSHIALKNVKLDEVYTVLDGVKISLSEGKCLVVDSILTNNVRLVTNDLVELVGRNQFKWLGRSDFVINTGGLKIHPSLLELEIQKLLSEENIELGNFFIIGVPDEKLGEKVVVCIEGNKVDLSNVMSRLNPYDRPKEIFFVDRFEYTKTEKVSKRDTIERLLGELK